MNLYEVKLEIGVQADTLEEAITKVRAEIGKIDVDYTTLVACEQVEEADIMEIPSEFLEDENDNL